MFALVGPTLTLRAPGPEDAPALLELASDPEVTRWFSWGPYTDVAQPAAYVERCAAQREQGEQLDLLVVHRDRGPAGMTGLSEFSKRDARCVIGTWFGRDFWGSGTNRESKAMMMRLAFDVLGMHRIGAYSNPDNARSTSSLQAVGFRREGVLRDWHRHAETWLDVNVFGLLADEWAAGPLAQIPVDVQGAPPPPFLDA